MQKSVVCDLTNTILQTRQNVKQFEMLFVEVSVRIGRPRPLGSICPLGRGFFLLSLILVCWDALLPNFLILYFIVCIFIWCGRMDSDIRK